MYCTDTRLKENNVTQRRYTCRACGKKQITLEKTNALMDQEVAELMKNLRVAKANSAALV